MKVIKVTKEYFQTEDDNVYFFEPLEKEISVEDMQKDALFAETSPAPVKYAASLLGLCDAGCRLPLAPLQESTKTRIRAAMRGAGLLR